MSLGSCSEYEFLRTRIYNYLGFYGAGRSAETDLLIDSSLSELEKISQFNYTYKYFDTHPEFLKKEPYMSFLSGAQGVIICAMTLGAGVDRVINRLMRTDMQRGVVLDACASAYLEYRSDEYERTVADNLSYRFCPGYGGSSIKDLRDIFEIISPEKIGITLNQSDFMLPAKSMAGVIAVGKKPEKSCSGCFMAEDCGYLKEGTRCYASEKK